MKPTTHTCPECGSPECECRQDEPEAKYEPEFPYPEDDLGDDFGSPWQVDIRDVAE
jgi:hypothetical protein